MRAAWGWINQRPVLRPLTSATFLQMEVPSLNEQNSILVYVLGKPGDSLTVEIIQDVDWLSFQRAILDFREIAYSLRDSSRRRMVRLGDCSFTWTLS